MWWDQQFTPEQHGDPYERLWCHFLGRDFPEWGVFWSHHVVPLTNRIVDDFECDHAAKLYIRYDPHIFKGLEKLVMANYSIFYFLARSCAIVSSEPHLFPEDVFIFLRATTENISKFLDAFTNSIAPKLSIDKEKIPKWRDIKSTETAEQILNYRDAFVHCGRLGRHPNLPWEFIPKHSHILRTKEYWRYVQRLSEQEFVDSRDYLRKLQVELMRIIDPVWKQVTFLLDERRTTQAYLTYYRLYKDPSGKLRPIKWIP
jgi:hypothetical protein